MHCLVDKGALLLHDVGIGQWIQRNQFPTWTVTLGLKGNEESFDKNRVVQRATFAEIDLAHSERPWA